MESDRNGICYDLWIFYHIRLLMELLSCSNHIYFINCWGFTRDQEGNSTKWREGTLLDWLTCHLRSNFINIGLISIYFGVFCLALSYLAIIATLLMLIKPKRTILKSPLKISILLLICLVMNDGSFLSGISIMSGQLKLCLILPLLYYSLWRFDYNTV